MYRVFQNSMITITWQENSEGIRRRKFEHENIEEDNCLQFFVFFLFNVAYVSD